VDGCRSTRIKSGGKSEHASERVELLNSLSFVIWQISVALRLIVVERKGALQTYRAEEVELDL
jgi:hypothetical protein